MRYLHILSAFAAEPWAMQPEKLEAIASFLAFKAHGGELSAEEIAAKIDGRKVAAVSRAAGDIVVLPLMGIMSQRVGMTGNVSESGASTEDFGDLFRAAVADDTVKAIVMNIHSPGGSTFGVQELADEIFAARGTKPIIAQVNSRAASAAYWVAAQADEIAVTPSGEAGSIGVYSVHEDISKKLEAEGVKATIVSAGDFKTELSGLTPLSEDARSALQGRVNAANAAFVDAVARGRAASTSMVNDRFGQGRMFDAPALVERGMADSVGTLRDTLARLGAPTATLRGNPGRQMRQAFAAGETPKLSLLEDHLRDGGFPGDLAKHFVSLGKPALRRSDSGGEVNEPASRQGLNALRELVAGFTPPNIKS